MALITARHKVFGICEVPVDYPDIYPGVWVPVDGEAAAAVVGDELFDPTAHPVNGDGVDGRPLGVVDYLASVADDAERDRVIEAERARGDAARKTVLSWTPTPVD